MSLSRLLPVVLACALAACGGDPAPTLLDGGSDPDPAARCLIPTSYAALGAQTGNADLTGDNSLTIVIAAGPPKDDLFFSLIAGQGVFKDGIKPGAYEITGDDANFNTCGLCTTILAHIDAQKGPAKFFFADAGTVTLTRATATSPTATSQIVGSASGLHFTEIDLGAGGGGAPILGGCQTAIDSVSFTSDGGGGSL